MTALIAGPPQRENVWSAMPGWGIVADLTPPEVVAARRLKFLQRCIGVGLMLVIVLCVAGYALAMQHESAASDAVAAANAETTQLSLQTAKYARVTQLQSATQSINSQVGVLMASDVDVAKLLAELRAVLPGSMSLTSINVSITPVGGDGSTDTATLDSSGRPTIGTITLNGTAQQMNDLATYVTALTDVKGVVGVVPTSNASGTIGGAQWNITLQVTDQLYTHRYLPKSTGSK